MQTVDERKNNLYNKSNREKAVKCTMEKDNLIKQLKEIVKHELNTQEQLRNRLKNINYNILFNNGMATR